ncbi:hypothetical protein RJD24_19475 [Bacillaceae bacterium IKA-2]|nr:hypothetical protein RJD24_19475 [Bacillaceae bacterium IKA-2]
MEKYIDVMKQSVELSETTLEGLQHIQKLLTEGKFEETMSMFEDIVSAFSTMQQSLTPVTEKLENHQIESTSNKVQDALELVVSAYEAKSHGKVQEIIQFTLTPQMKKWKEELEEAFQTYIVS